LTNNKNKVKVNQHKKGKGETNMKKVITVLAALLATAVYADQLTVSADVYTQQPQEATIEITQQQDRFGVSLATAWDFENQQADILAGVSTPLYTLDTLEFTTVGRVGNNLYTGTDFTFEFNPYAQAGIQILHEQGQPAALYTEIGVETPLLTGLQTNPYVQAGLAIRY